MTYYFFSFFVKKFLMFVVNRGKHLTAIIVMSKNLKIHTKIVVVPIIQEERTLLNLINKVCYVSCHKCMYVFMCVYVSVSCVFVCVSWGERR